MSSRKYLNFKFYQFTVDSNYLFVRRSPSLSRNIRLEKEVEDIIARFPNTTNATNDNLQVSPHVDDKYDATKLQAAWKSLLKNMKIAIDRLAKLK